MSTPSFKEIRQFMGAAEKGDVKAIAEFLAHHPGAIDTPFYSRTALFVAAQYGKADAVEFLLNKGANAHIKDSGSMTAYDIAAGNARKEVLAVLEKRGIGPSRKVSMPKPKAPGL